MQCVCYIARSQCVCYREVPVCYREVPMCLLYFIFVRNVNLWAMYCRNNDTAPDAGGLRS